MKLHLDWPYRALLLVILALAHHGSAASTQEGGMAQRIQHGESFLTNLFNTQLQLLPEYRGSRTYWLFHDNYLAAHVLAKSRPDLSTRIRSALAQFGVTNSGKIEIVLGEAKQPLPFRNYVLTNVAILDGKTIRTERVTTNILKGWEEYADLLLLASMAQAESAPAEARKAFDQAVAMWDGDGFKDRAAQHSGIYATYKLALYLIAADRLNVAAPHRDTVQARLLALQASSGGWRTDYTKDKPVGLANVETTCLSLLALRTLRTAALGERKLNNLVSVLLEASALAEPSAALTFTRARDGWICIAATCQGKGTVRITLDKESEAVLAQDAEAGLAGEAMRFVGKGEHTLQVQFQGGGRVDKLSVKSIPELIHCGLGFHPEIKAYGLYDMDFLKKDILPNITTLIVPSNIQLAQSVIEDWHRQGKRFVAEAGIHGEAKTAEEHLKHWTGFYERAPFLDGIIINEFIVNNPSTNANRLTRMAEEQQRHAVYGEALKKLRADERYGTKTLYAYVGGSGKKLNQEMIGTNFIRAIMDCGYQVALERYLHEMSSTQGSEDALRLFVEGIADWEAKEPGVKEQMVIAFGLFSMPPGGINKQPNVDYHVWMDRQMQLTANHPALSGIAGLEWWTSILADEETVRFVGKLYRHYAIEGQTNLLTRDPLFLTHLQNADFEKGTEGWTLHAAAEGSMAPRSFPRYGRIEGRYMGLGRPADPEHIGDTFLWMQRNAQGPNTFSQTIKDLQPGRLYSMKLFTCDYNDLVNPQAKKRDEATCFIGSVRLEGVEVDSKRSFSEMYASNPEPKIPVWITYHWKVFRAQSTTATLTVSDWPEAKEPGAGFGQEQTFNFVEIQPYWE